MTRHPFFALAFFLISCLLPLALQGYGCGGGYGGGCGGGGGCGNCGGPCGSDYLPGCGARCRIFESGYTWINFGYRQDWLRWKGEASHKMMVPAEKIDEKWEQILMWEGSLYTLQRTRWGLCFRFRGMYAGACKGGFERDLLGDRREEEGRSDTLEVTRRIRGSLARGRFYDLSPGVGYEFDLCTPCGRLLFAPLLGVALHEQRLRRGCARLLCDCFGHVERWAKRRPGCLEGCHKRCLGKHRDAHELNFYNRFYRSRWWGPWVGADLIWEYGCCLVFSGTGEYYPSNQFHGREIVKDKKRNRHVTLQQRSDGGGWYGEVGGHWSFRDNWLLNLSFSGNRFEAHGGSMETQVKPLGRRLSRCYLYKERTRFDSILWYSMAVTLGLDYRW